MANQMDPREVIEKMLKDANSTEDVLRLRPIMGQQLVIQMAFPVAVFKADGRDWVPTGQFANVCQGVIQPCPISDRVLIILPNNTGMFVRAVDIQATYIPLQTEEKSPIILMGS